MDSEPSFLERVLQYTQREQLLLQCPALVLLVYQYIVTGYMRRECIVDPLLHTAHADSLSRWLCARNVKTFIRFIFAPIAPNSDSADADHARAESDDIKQREESLRRMFQRVLASVCFPVCSSAQPTRAERAPPHVHRHPHTDDTTLLSTISGQVRFVARAIANTDNTHEMSSTTAAPHPTPSRVFSSPTRTSSCDLLPCLSNPWSAAESSWSQSSRPLQTSTLSTALMNSRAHLRAVTSCALDGSLQSLKERRFQALGYILQASGLVQARAVDAPHRAGMSAESSTITAEGLNFCMLAVSQQWWILLNCALDRVLALAHAQLADKDSSTDHAATTVAAAAATSASSLPRGSHASTVVDHAKGDGGTRNHDKSITAFTRSNTTRPMLWQLLAILATFECERFMFAFPEKQDDLVAHILLVRLIEIGLVYPVKSNEAKYFVLSPHFRHALLWQAAAPLCLSAMLEDDRLSSAQRGAQTTPAHRRLQREDTDTIITETNFRLYAYTGNKGLLNILDQFAEREEEVRGGVVCYRVTRPSFVTAVRKGITARQMLKFLALHAHPNMRSRYADPTNAGGRRRRTAAIAAARRRRGGRMWCGVWWAQRRQGPHPRGPS